MSLAAEVEAMVVDESARKLCPYARMLEEQRTAADPKVNPEELDALLVDRAGPEFRHQATHIHRVLFNRGVSVSVDSLQRHRSGRCSCR